MWTRAESGLTAPQRGCCSISVKAVTQVRHDEAGPEASEFTLMLTSPAMTWSAVRSAGLGMPGQKG